MKIVVNPDKKIPDKKYAPAINTVEIKYNIETFEWDQPDLCSLWNK